ncbi:uncharacterized protein isoform X2 [Rhodnius prolixus]|uniref:uncharacterized protein isoform X2 n=1 Tax=Rhodnius prolixus TaxID=13249 RepID=UPI003D18FB04
MEMELPQEDLDIAFTEWTEKLDAGSNHWLPAYGYQQPSQLHEALFQQDFLNSDGLNQHVYLETIVEETSDDLRSDSEYSDEGGWRDTDSETDSVIHIPNNIGVCTATIAEWGGSERDLAVPKKRRRRQFNNDPGVQDDEDEADDFLLPPVTSRSSSLLQFETLEKQCNTVFRASASSEQFVHSPSLASSFSFDSLETSRWRFSGSPDSLNEEVASSISSSCSSSSELTSSEEEAVEEDDLEEHFTRSYSSRSFGNDSYRSSLRSHRSFDSLIMCQEKQDSLLLSAELSQSLDNTAIFVEEDNEPIAPPRGLYKTVECLTESGYTDEKEPKSELVQAEKCAEESKNNATETSKGQRSAENLSEDSGFGEHIPRGGSLRRVSSTGVFTIAENEDDSSQSSYGSDNGMNTGNVVKIHVGGNSGCEGEIEGGDLVVNTVDGERVDEVRRGGWSDAVPNYSNGWQSAPDLLKLQPEHSQSECNPCQLNNPIVPHKTHHHHRRLLEDNPLIGENQPITSTTSLLAFTIDDDDDELLIVPEKKTFLNSTKKMASRHPVVSTPNLYMEDFQLGENEYELKFPETTTSSRKISRAHSFKETGRRESNLRKCKSRGSNIQITTSFINLTKQYNANNVQITTSFVNLTAPAQPTELDFERFIGSGLLESGGGGGESKVHFCPVVSEVTWKDRVDYGEEVEEEISGEVSLDAKKEYYSGVVLGDARVGVTACVEEVRKGRGGDRATLPPPPAPPVTHKPPIAGHRDSTNTATNMERSPQSKPKSGIGGFFQRFSLRRLSSRDKKRKNLKKEAAIAAAKQPEPIVVNNIEELQMIIPLHPPADEEELETVKVPSRTVKQSTLPPPPLPPPPSPPKRSTLIVGITGSAERRLNGGGSCEQFPVAASLTTVETEIGGGTTSTTTSSVVMSAGGSLSAPAATTTVVGASKAVGLLETDLDSTDATGACNSKKARSLLNLGDGRTQLVPCIQPDQPVDHRAKSMEFLLDKENKFAAKPPENELQKVGERVMSEHELRVQRSLQRLHVPEWYKNSQVPVQGFLLKRHSEGGGGQQTSTTGWQGLSSKTTSLSSLGSNQAATPRSPSGQGVVLSPSPTPSGHTFSRWSTSRLNSNPTSTSTSPCGSARSSFNYRQPYLGWRSQERLSNPRTPAERLAQGLLPTQKQQNVPNLSEVHSSIKEVTSAIVHYVSGSRGDDRLSPATLARHDNPSSRSGSPRGSTGRLCWLESSFVGNRPLDVPETPVSLTATPEHQGRGSQLYLNLTATHTPDIATVNGSVSGDKDETIQYSSDVRRHSEGCEPISTSTAGLLQQSGSTGFIRTGPRRVSFDMAIADGDLVHCRYTKCNRSAPLAEAKRTFKTCHNCTHVYCSRECRRAHWEKHRKTCLHSRVGALCRKVMSNIKEDEDTLHHVSLVARKGFLAKGRGAVKVLFSRPKVAEEFVGEGRARLGEPLYVKWSDLQMEETGREMHEELVRLCKSYNPDTRLVLYVAVCVVSEVPTSGAAVKWEMQVVSRCAKLRLSAALASPHQHTPVISRDLAAEPETLILTSLPGARDQGTRKARQVSFTNIQRHLRQRGISLRRQFPEVYQRLCSYVEGSTERFIPVTIYPRDAATGKNFMCIIMPDAEPEKLEMIPTDSAHVQTIDISADPHSSV